MDHLFKSNKYKYDDHTYIFSHGGVDTHPDNSSPNLKTCKESMTMTSTYDDMNSKTPNNPSNENTHNNKSILSMQDIVIIRSNNIFQQNSKYDFKAYKHLHGTDMQIHSIPKPPKQKAHDMGLYKTGIYIMGP
jgi:hypothetical protein